MIYYFSGTGNSKWVAEQLAIQTSDEAVNMIGCTDVAPVDGQTVGIVFPIHAWGVPEPVQEFVIKLAGQPGFTFSVCTCGDEAGEAMNMLNRLLPLNSSYSIALPSNYVMGADVESDDSIRSKTANAREKIKTIAAHVIARRSVHDVNKGKMSWVKSNLANFGFNRFARSTKPFHATDKCTSCGLCATICPANTISLIDGKVGCASGTCPLTSSAGGSTIYGALIGYLLASSF